MKLLAILDGEQRAYDRANAVKKKTAGMQSCTLFCSAFSTC